MSKKHPNKGVFITIECIDVDVSLMLQAEIKQIMDDNKISCYNFKCRFADIAVKQSMPIVGRPFIAVDEYLETDVKHLLSTSFRMYNKTWLEVFIDTGSSVLGDSYLMDTFIQYELTSHMTTGALKSDWARVVQQGILLPDLVIWAMTDNDNDYVNDLYMKQFDDHSWYLLDTTKPLHLIQDRLYHILSKFYDINSVTL